MSPIDPVAPADRWSAELAEALGGAGDRRRLASPRHWPGPHLDLTPSDVVDAAAVRMLVAGRSVRLSQLVVPASFPHMARRLRAVERAGRSRRDRYGVDLVRIVLGTVTWDSTESAEPGDHPEPAASRDATPPILPALVAAVGLSPRSRGDADIVVQGPWGLPPAVIDRLAEAGVELDPVTVLGPEGGGRLALERLGRAGGDLAGFRVNQRVLVGVLPYLGRSPEAEIRGAATGPATTLRALVGDTDAGDARSDTARSPWIGADTRLLLPTDREQRGVIDAVTNGADVVVEACPGTGTTATIANIAVRAASSGRSVLVVAEEDATRRRLAATLDAAGLGPLVVDVAAAGPADTPAGRRRVLQRLVTALDARAATPDTGAETPPEAASDTRAAHGADPAARRSELEQSLVDYDQAIHAVREPWGVSVDHLIGELLGVEGAAGSSSEARLPPADLDPTDSDPTHGAPTDTDPTDDGRVWVELAPHVTVALPVHQLDAIGDDLAGWVRLGGPMLHANSSVWTASLGVITQPDHVAEVGDVLTRLVHTQLPEARQASIDLAEALGAPAPGSIRGADELSGYLDDLGAVLQRYRPEALDPSSELGSAIDTSDGDAPMPTRSRRGQSVRRARRALQSARIDGSRPSHDEAIHDLQLIARLRAGVAGWVPADPTAVTPHETARQRLTELAESLDRLGRLVPAIESLSDFDELTESLGRLDAERHMLDSMPELHRLQRRLLERELADVLDSVVRRALGPDQAVRLLRWSWVRSVLDGVLASDEVLGSLDPRTLDRQVDELREIDGRQRQRVADDTRIAVARSALSNDLVDDAAVVEIRAGAGSASPPALHDVLRAPIRSILSVAPIWLMSPHEVAEVVPQPASADEPASFDIVLVTGAERLPSPAAMPALARARQSVVVGDPRRSSDRPGVHTLFGRMRELAPADCRHRLRWYRREGDGRLCTVAELVAGREPGAILAVATPGPDVPVTIAPVARDVFRSLDNGVPSAGLTSAALRSGAGPSGAGPSQAPRTSPRELLLSGPIDWIVDLVADHVRTRRSSSLAVVAPDDESAALVDAALRSATETERVLDRPADRSDSGDGPVIVCSVDGLAGRVADHVLLVLAPNLGSWRVGEVATVVASARHLLTLVPIAAGPAELAPDDLSGPPPDPSWRLVSIAASGAAAATAPTSVSPDPVLVDVAARLRSRGVPFEHVPGRVPELTLQHPRDPMQPLVAVLGDRPLHDVLVSVVDREVVLAEHLVRLGWQVHRIRSLAWWRDAEVELDRLVEVWHALVQPDPDSTSAGLGGRQLSDQG